MVFIVRKQKLIVRSPIVPKTSVFYKRSKCGKHDFKRAFDNAACKSVWYFAFLNVNSDLLMEKYKKYLISTTFQIMKKYLIKYDNH